MAGGRAHGGVIQPAGTVTVGCGFTVIITAVDLLGSATDVAVRVSLPGDVDAL